MEQEILNLIKEKLPAIQAEAIAAYVKEAEDDKMAIKNATERILRLDNKLDAVNALHRNCCDFEEREDAVAIREANCLRAEQKKDLLNCKLDCEREKVALVQNMFKTVFRNVEIKRTVLGNTAVACAPGQYPESGGFNKEETVSRE